MEDNRTTYFSNLDDGVSVYEEDVNTADAPTPLRPGYEGNVGSPNAIRCAPKNAPFVILVGEIVVDVFSLLDFTRAVSVTKNTALGTYPSQINAAKLAQTTSGEGRYWLYLS